MLKGRLGLETVRVPHADRHGLLWLSRGVLTVDSGCLQFAASGAGDLPAGLYDIPFQGISILLLGPGSTVSHDVLRLMARHGTGLVAVGDDGVRVYTAPPLGADDSRVARAQARVWADAEGTRLDIARRLYAWRLGEILPHKDINILRGIEGARARESYKLLADRHGIKWQGRRYDRADPTAADGPNQAINHAATAVEAAAAVAVAAVAAVPQLGFIHEDSANAFTLDIADLFRDLVTLPVAFQAVRRSEAERAVPLERHVRRIAGRTFQDQGVIPAMIDRIKSLFDIAE